MLAVAAGVVILGGGFAAAYFGGALDGVLGRSQPVTQAAKDKSDEATTEAKTTTTTAAATTKAAETTTKAAETTTTTTAAKTTTAAATTKAAEVAATTAGSSVASAVIERKQSPAMARLFSQMNIETHVSDDATPRGAIEETLVNITSMVLGSARNVSADQSAAGGNTFGFEMNLAMDVSDPYINEVMTAIFGSLGGDPQLKEIIRLAGASNITVGLGGGGDITDDMWNPVFALNADWLVKSKPFFTMAGYFDLKEILVSVPDLYSKVIKIDSTLTPIPAGDLQTVQTQTAQLQAFGPYIEEFMPFIKDMLIAAVGELQAPVIGKEEIKLAGKSVTFDTVDLAVTEKEAMKAGVAALNVIKYSPAAQDLIVRANNETLKDMFNTPQLDRQTLSLAIDGMIAQANENAEYSYSEDVVRVRMYMNDGIFAGLALSNPTESAQYGYVGANEAGYSLWINDLMYSEYEELKDDPPSYKDPGVGDRFEFYGLMNSGPSGVSGDFRVNVRQYEETFDEKLLTFSDLNTKVSFGIPAITGKISVKMRDIYNAFSGKTDSSIPFVWQTAYTMEELDAMPFVKDLEFSLEFIANENDYTMRFKAQDPARGSSAEISFKGYYLNKGITPPGGERLDIANASPQEQMALMAEAKQNLDAKFDELLVAGYDLTWLKPLIESALSGTSPGGAEGFEGLLDGDGDEGDAGEYGADENGVNYLGYTVEDYVFPYSSDTKLDPNELNKLPTELLSLARNEIYARHGWVFDDIDLQIYFNQHGWYTPLFDNDSIELNKIEEINVGMITAIESLRE